jgi:pimeloyl-ACP methyl ester carboxylesterase
MMAHSGGTPFAIMAAARAPELYHAYIGMAQITRQAESEKIAWEYMMKQYVAAGNNRASGDLMKYPVKDSASMMIPFYLSLVRDKSMHDLGIGTMHKMRSVFSGVFIPVWMCRAYTLKEKMKIWESKFKFIKKAKFVNELFAADIPSEVPELKIPVYFFSGMYDLTVNASLSKAYLSDLKAPVKGFYTFTESAHSPLFEEPGKVRKILKEDVLNAKTELADH